MNKLPIKENSSKNKMDWKLKLYVLNIAQKTSKELIEESTKIKQNVQKVQRWSRVPKELIGHEVEVHNGKAYIRLKIVKERVGHRFGEFATTTVWSTINKDDATRRNAEKQAAQKSKAGSNKGKK